MRRKPCFDGFNGRLNPLLKGSSALVFYAQKFKTLMGSSKFTSTVRSSPF